MFTERCHIFLTSSMWFRLLHHISRDLVHMAAFIQRHNWRSYTCQLTSTLMSVWMSIVPWFVTSSLLKIYSYSLLWLQWPIPEPPEPPGLIKRYPALVMERGPPLQAATVLQRRLVPSGTDIRSLLAWFYDTMSYEHSKHEKGCICRPLPERVRK